MRTTDAYGELLRMDRPIVATREAAARWQTERRAASKRLRAMADAGLVRHLRQGLWALDPDVDPLVVPPFLTAPYPAYVSFWSALSRHGMIEQIPRRIWVASLDRTKRVATAAGAFEIHHLAPGVFGGFDGTEETGYLATPEKCLFDTVYVRAAAGSRAYFPELSLGRDFDQARMRTWTDRIGGRRLHTLVSRRIEEVLREAS
ncbi:MAG: hypothetical protein WD404_04385 [Solirubrobacterales bacterium]